MKVGDTIWIATLTTESGGGYTTHELVITEEALAEEIRVGVSGWSLFKATVTEVALSEDEEHREAARQRIAGRVEEKLK